MKITQNTNEQLVLDHKPLFIPLFTTALAISQVGILVTKYASLTTVNLCIVIFMLVIAVIATLFFSVGSRFEFNRDSDLVKWHRSGWFNFRYESGQAKLDSIKNVFIETDTSGAEGDISHRLVISSGNKVIPTTLHFSNCEAHEKMYKEIHHWLAG